MRITFTQLSVVVCAFIIIMSSASQPATAAMIVSGHSMDHTKWNGGEVWWAFELDETNAGPQAATNITITGQWRDVEGSTVPPYTTIEDWVGGWHFS